MDIFSNDFIMPEQNAMMQDTMLQQQDMMQQQAYQQQQLLESQMMQQQMMMQNQMSTPVLPNMNMYGNVDMYGNTIRVTRGQAVQALRDYIISLSGAPIMKEIKIDETPDLLRHACVNCGISHLPKNIFPIPAMCSQITFYFCKSCGTLFYTPDF